jgi:uncharacterized membrane protein YccC
MQEILLQYRRFVSSHYFYEGLRLTVSILAPVFAGAYLGHIELGVSAGLGALAVGIVDFAGPVHHRINGMTAAVITAACVTGITHLLAPYTWFTACWIVVAAFAFSIITLFGNRASQLGTAALILLTIFTDEAQQATPWWLLTLLVAGGGLFYFAFSLALYRIRPYKLAQQALGQCIAATARYFEVKAAFYGPSPELNKLNGDLATAHTEANTEQQNVRELLFKTRSIVRESTQTGRALVLAFMELTDLHEAIISSHPNYTLLQTHFEGSALLERTGLVLQKIAGSLTEAAIARQEGNTLPPDETLDTAMVDLQLLFEQTRRQSLTARNLGTFVAMSHVIETLAPLCLHTQRLRTYTAHPPSPRYQRRLDYQRFVTPTRISLRLVFNNLGWQSNVLRFSVRMAVAMLSGYLLSLLMPLGHAYWVLLTIAVILKPAYAITRKRNADRLWGTLAGAVAGAMLLMMVYNHSVLLGFLIAFMIASFSLWRHRYLLSVAFMTAFILLAFHLLRPGNYEPLILDRLADTALGSIIALLTTWLIPPLWERNQVQSLATAALVSVQRYLLIAVEPTAGNDTNNSEYRLRRKNALVDVANLNDAFQRMATEPGTDPGMAAYWHQLVVALHALVANIAALKGLVQKQAIPAIAGRLAQQSGAKLTNAISIMRGNGTLQAPHGLDNNSLQKTAGNLLKQREEELNRGELDGGTRHKLVAAKMLADYMDTIDILSGEAEKTVLKLQP